MRKGKENEVTEQEKITDTVRGREVKNKDTTKKFQHKDLPTLKKKSYFS